MMEASDDREISRELTQLRRQISDLSRRPGDHQEKIAALQRRVAELKPQQKVGDAVRSIQRSESEPQQRQLPSRNTITGGGYRQKSQAEIDAIPGASIPDVGLPGNQREADPTGRTKERRVDKYGGARIRSGSGASTVRRDSRSGGYYGSGR